MIDSFNIVSSKSIIESRGKTPNFDQYDSYEQDDPAFLVQLPIHLLDLSNELKKMISDDADFNLSVLISSLKCIYSTLNELGYLPYNRFKAYWPQLFEDLMVIIQPGQIKEEIQIALSIIGIYFCDNPSTIQLVYSSNFVKLFLDWFNDDIEDIFIQPILCGISGLINFEDETQKNGNSNEAKQEEESPEKIKSISQYFLSNNLNERLLEIFFNSQNAIIPVREIGMIVKRLIKKQNNEEYLESLLSFLPIISALLDTKMYAEMRLSIQSARHLIAKFPQTRKDLNDSGYVDNLVATLYSEDSSFGVFKSAIYFLRYYCQGDPDACGSIFTNDLMILTLNMINSNLYKTDKIKHILIDIDQIMLNDKSLVYPVVDTDLLSFLLDNSTNGQFQISITSSVILCDIIASYIEEAAHKVIDGNFLESLEQTLTCGIPNTTCVALDAIVDLFNMDEGNPDGQFIQNLKEQEWLPEVISDLCNPEENDDRVFNKAQYIYERIIPIVFNDE